MAHKDEVLSLVHDDGLSTAAFSPNGSAIVTASWDKTARIWDSTTGEELKRFAHDGSVASATFSADGSQVPTASFKAARLWKVETGSELVRFVHDDYVHGASFSPAVDAKSPSTARSPKQQSLRRHSWRLGIAIVMLLLLATMAALTATGQIDILSVMRQLASVIQR